MKIGIDLDNTLVCYDEAFKKCGERLDLLPASINPNRLEIREYIRKQINGEKAWQKLQGQVYGVGLSNAKLFPGVYRFLWRCRQRGVFVEVISHKTEYGHYDTTSTPLHEAAIAFLILEGVYTEDKSSFVESVSFYPTREEKIQAISERKLDWFIDDLPEVYESHYFPLDTNKLGFDPNLENKFADVPVATSWLEIEHQLLGLWQESELALLASELGVPRFQYTRRIGGRGNSGIYKVKTTEDRVAALKIYVQESNHNRLYSEHEGLKLLNEAGFTNISRPIGCAPNLGVALYDWVEGKTVDTLKLSDIDQALLLVEQLYNVRISQIWKSFPSASAAAFCGKDLEDQIINRFQLLASYAPEYSVLHEFLNSELKSIISEIVEWGRLNWPDRNAYSEELPLRLRTLSPSDFGFHNALRNETGNIIFLDWEYFGWDDPAKLVGDFLLHPGMNLTDEMKSTWLSGAVRIFGHEIMPRLRVFWPYLTLCWCLILLNEYRRDIWARRATAANFDTTPNPEMLEEQFTRSRTLARGIAKTYREFPY